MEPRRSTSKKWTDLPKDYLKQVIEALKESFADEVKSGRFVVDGRIYPDELLIRMGFLEKGRLHQDNFEISADYKAGKEDTLKLLNLMMDVGATMLEELFSAGEEADFPRIWEPFEVDGRMIYLQFTGANSELEEKADAILGVDKKLVTGEDEPSAEEIKAKLGLDPEDDEDEMDDEDDGDDPPTRH